jgi:hypothetical protein
MSNRGKAAKKLSPMRANGKTLACLPRSVKDIGSAWILTDGYSVTIKKQRVGEYPTEEITLSRGGFNRLVRWYIREQTIRRPQR